MVEAPSRPVPASLPAEAATMLVDELDGLHDQDFLALMPFKPDRITEAIRRLLPEPVLLPRYEKRAAGRKRPGNLALHPRQRHRCNISPLASSSNNRILVSKGYRELGTPGCERDDSARRRAASKGITVFNGTALVGHLLSVLLRFRR